MRSKAQLLGPRSSRPPLILFVAGAVLIGLTVLTFISVRSHSRLVKAVSQTDGHNLASRRTQLLSMIDEFNQLAKAGGQQTIEIGTAAAGAIAAATATPIAAASGASAWHCGENKVLPEAYKMRPANVVEQQYPELAAKLKAHASKDKEILLTLANGIMICKNTTICWWNGGNILESFITILTRNNIKNHLIGVLDDETELYLKDRPGVNWMRLKIEAPESQKDSHPANRVSTIKYTLIQAVLEMGYHTLISDMDLVYIDDPFKHLHRDSDIEIQTDGFDPMSYGTIAGITDPSMGWGGGGLYIQLFTTNVGCMYARATQRTFTLMKQVAKHLLEKAGWDQQVFNEYLLVPSNRDFVHSGATLRVMDYMKFVNSKIFFKSERDKFLPGKTATAATPVMVHFNYHPDKHKRMLCIMDRYFYNKIDACDAFPPGTKA